MRTLGNIIWFVLGGFLMGIGWYLVGLLAFISIIGIPWGKACFVIGSFSFFHLVKNLFLEAIMGSLILEQGL